MIKNAWRKISYQTSVDYRQFYLPSDIPTARVVVILLAITIAAFTISDYTIFGLTPIFYGLIALRLGLVAYSMYLFRYLKHTKNYKRFDTSIVAYSLVVVLGILLVNLTRPENFIPHIIVIDMAVLTFYLVLPTRFAFQAAPSIMFSLGEIGVVMMAFPLFMEPGLATALVSLAFANIVGALISLQIHAYRWHNYQNIIERKETERLAAIGQTAGMIGHDIRNPLQAIVSELYIAQKSIDESRMPEETKKDTQESISLIGEQTDYISKIVSDLQDYARPLKPEFKQVDLAKLVASIFHTIRIPKDILIKKQVADSLKIKTDPTMIRRAITNLVNNAVQAMPEGGTLEVTAFREGDNAVILVRDTGMGIPEEMKQRLFTPLITTKAKGQGLGLAVVKRLVEALGGSVAYESELGKGTTFTVTLLIKE